MKIHVRRRHIVAGQPKRVTLCPIALAYFDLNGEVPIVGEDGIDCLEHSYALPRSARQFIARFDAGKPVKPFAFVLK